ncbi:cell division protein FtsX [Saccharopolyspora sp. K220]|uniref:ABC transporter permease n=1 Tax=Saccharopolyspora soli TaxID=2926618 RepID=UPI001F56A1A1|nr:ABC transporter permease [Saccharopolyspora soli]MCI2416504.1 cell division protein FtsX [Saccharopolyspora soli]
MTTARDWLRNLVFGLRLAISGPKPWGRLAVTAVGIGLGVALLLAAAAIPNAYEARMARDQARTGSTDGADASAGVLVAETWEEYLGQSITGILVQDRRPDAPVAPGLTRNPGPGQMVVSPALRQLLENPGGGLLRPRLPDQIVGIVGEEGLVSPNELFYYVGTDSLSPQGDTVRGVIDHFGEGQVRDPMSTFPTDAWFVLALGLAALLVPVVVYVAATARLAETARQRRLAALRLVGASGEQVRRMAAGESLAGAMLGVALGWALFLVARTVVSNLTVGDVAVFQFDVQPVWWLAALVTLGIPAVAVLVTIASLRHTITEPLEVARRTVAQPRRLGWRLVPLVLGALGLLLIGVDGAGRSTELPMFVASVVLMLIAIPVLLPWCVERAVARLRGGSTAWQLAVRRLQLASGPAARSVSAIAVVVTGVIGLQTVVSTVESDVTTRTGPVGQPQQWGDASISGALPASATVLQQAERELRALPGLTDVRRVIIADSDYQYGQQVGSVIIGDCAELARLVPVPDCRDGDAFVPQSTEGPVRPGEMVRFTDPYYDSNTRPMTDGVSWQVPGQLRQVGPVDMVNYQSAGLLLTPAAATGIPDSVRKVTVELKIAPAASPDLLEHVRNIAAAYLPDSGVSYPADLESVAASQARPWLAAVRAALLAGALLTFALIGCSMFVSAAEQIQERRRPLAVLGAVGVRRRTLWWSLLLQNAVPMLVATALAAVVGVLLGVLAAVATDAAERLVFDIPGMLGLFVFAAAAVLVMTALTLPALGRATNPTGLRTE